MQVNSLNCYLSRNWFERYKLGERNAMRIPNMTKEQVENANKTKQLPDNYWLMTKEKDNFDQNGRWFTLERSLKEPSMFCRDIAKTINMQQPVMTIIKGKRVYTKDFPHFYNIVPEGYEIEKNVFGTFLKKSDVKSATFNYFQPTIYTSLGAATYYLLNAIYKRIKHK